jgi:hypothetical protein
MQSLKIILAVLALFCGLTLPAQHKGDIIIADGKVRYETTIPYEAIHIALALTDTNIYSGSMNVHYEILDTASAYYRQVQQHFAPYRQHALVKALSEGLRKDLLRYVQNIKQAYNCQWADGFLLETNTYPLPMRMQFQLQSAKQKTVEAFIKDAGVVAFYNANKDLYTQTLQRVKDFANVADQQRWLEQYFDTRYQQYRIIVSPLMGSTNFNNQLTIDSKQTCLVYVADAKSYSAPATDADKARYLGKVMTEIDHNYVNPESDKYEKQLNKLMGDEQRGKWVKAEGAGKFYGSGLKVFNEYMTHAVYLLYTASRLSPSDQAVVVNNRVRMMEEVRGFYRFGAFYQALLQMQTRAPKRPIGQLYPGIIGWCEKQVGL